MKSFLPQQQGEGLIEVLITLAIAAVVIGAMATATIRGISNAQFSQTQVQATKLAQESLEKIRSIRDHNGVVMNGTTSYTFLNLLQDATICSGGCYVKITPSSNGYALTVLSGAQPQTTANADLSQIILVTTETVNGVNDVAVVVTVQWTDSIGTHQSQLETKYGAVQ